MGLYWFLEALKGENKRMSRKVDIRLSNLPDNITRKAFGCGFVYFMEDSSKRIVRIGWTENRDLRWNRILTHEKEGYKLLAILPGTQEKTETNIEGKLHKHFGYCQVEQGNNTELFKAEEVRPYIKKLLDWSYAVNDLSLVTALGLLDWRVIDPKILLVKKPRKGLFVTQQDRSEENDRWQTPFIMVERVHYAFDPKFIGLSKLQTLSFEQILKHSAVHFDCCTELDAQLRICARYFCTEHMNAFNMPWPYEKVFMNPTYGYPSAEEWIEYLIGQLDCGNIKEAITLLNLQSVSAKWIAKTMERATIHADWSTRPRFIGKLSKNKRSPAHNSARNGTIFSYWGQDPTNFVKSFSAIDPETGKSYAWIRPTLNNDHITPEKLSKMLNLLKVNPEKEKS
jgi:hypothetical protein